MLGRGVFGVRADIFIVKGAFRAGSADIAEHAVFLLVDAVIGGALNLRPGGADDVAHGIEGLGRDADLGSGAGFLPGFLVHGRDGVGVDARSVIAVIAPVHNLQTDVAGRGDGRNKGQHAPAPVVIGMAGKFARGIALMSEIDHVRGLGKAQFPQVGGGIGGLENLGRAVFIRYQTPVGQPDAHGLVPELQHAALGSGKNKGDQTGRVIVGHAQKTRAGSAGDAALGHGHEVAHLPRARAVARLIHPPAHQGGDLAAVKDILNMVEGHQKTIRSLRKEDRQTRSGRCRTSFSTLARSRARSNISR